jgi:hypothetical protein
MCLKRCELFTDVSFSVVGVEQWEVDFMKLFYADKHYDLIYVTELYVSAVEFYGKISRKVCPEVLRQQQRDLREPEVKRKRRFFVIERPPNCQR